MPGRGRPARRRPPNRRPPISGSRGRKGPNVQVDAAVAQGRGKRSNVISLPMGDGRMSPISAVDVARALAVVLDDPTPHIGHIYDLAGPRSEPWSFHAGEFSEALGRPITYEDIAPETWRERLVTWGLPSHLIDHLTAMAALNRQNRYDRGSDDVVTLTGAPAMGLREFVRRHAFAYTSAA